MGRQTDPLQPFFSANQGVRLGQTTKFQPERDIVTRHEPRQQGLALEHVPDAVRNTGDRASENLHIAAGRVENAGNEIQKRRLATTGRPDDRNELTVPEIQIDVFDGRIAGSVVATEFNADITERNRGPVVVCPACRRLRPVAIVWLTGPPSAPFQETNYRTSATGRFSLLSANRPMPIRS